MPQYPASEKRRIYWLAVLFGIGSVVYYLGYNFWETRNFWDFGKVHSSLTLTSVWEQTPLFIGVLSFIAATLAIYLLVPLVISFCSIQTARLFRVDKSQVMSLTFLVLLALLVWSPLVNGLLYPQSRFGQNFPSLFEGPVGMPLLFLLSAVLGIVLLLGAVVSSVDLLSAIKKSPGQRRLATAAVAVVAVATTGSIFISGGAHESTDVV
ncbi:MAG: hypothetical protein KJO35_06310, partial [Gammaproteobacteria bacterium]|nr:hypothetical protein [Gammaproteobacteria bacterium]